MSTRAGFDELFCIATDGAAPYHWQRALASRPTPAKWVLAATGSGKTEAVVMDWLWRWRLDPVARHDDTPRRLVLASPMRVLVEQTRGRVEGMLDRLDQAGLLNPVPRVHVLAGSAARDSWTLDPERDAVLVGTIDMLLSRALNRGFGKTGRARWPIDFGPLGADCPWGSTLRRARRREQTDAPVFAVEARCAGEPVCAKGREACALAERRGRASWNSSLLRLSSWCSAPAFNRKGFTCSR